MKRTPAIFGVLIWLFLSMQSSHSAPSKDLWSYWSAHDANSTQVIQYQPYQHFLDQYVMTNQQGVNLLRYDDVTSQEKQTLHEFVLHLASLPISQYNRAQQLAYWINLYNALTLDVVLQHYPVDSIRDIKLGSWFSTGPWNKKLLTIEGHSVSLNDIEHRILRPIWADARLHYALNCASYSCPNLQKNVFTAQNANQLMQQAAVEYINNPRGVNIEHDQLVLSSIYDWYSEDFGDNEQAVIDHLMQYAKPALKAKLKQFRQVDDYEYDWRLNDDTLIQP